MARQPQFVCEGIADSTASVSGASSPNAPGRTAPASSGAEPEDIFSSADLPWPDVRPLKVYAFDPSRGKFVGNYMTASVRYAKLLPRPVAERFSITPYSASTPT